jgi:hypothetical protein
MFDDGHIGQDVPKSKVKQRWPFDLFASGMVHDVT